MTHSIIKTARPLLLIPITVIAVGVWLGTDWYTTLPADTTSKYVGTKRCIECHQDQADLWTGSHHDLAMDVATEKTVLGNFDIPFPTTALCDHYRISMNKGAQLEPYSGRGPAVAALWESEILGPGERFSREE